MGMYPKEMKLVSLGGICMPLLIKALLAVARIWKQSECLSKDEWTKKTWCILHNGIVFSLKKEGNIAI